jgi:ABC-2 type transport system ATP-binding protein
MADAIRIENLKKSFRLGFIPKTKEILKGISFSVKEGEIFGYLGPNGAGKTTTIKCLLGLIFPDAGTIEIFGQPHLSARARQVLGFLPENPYFYDYLTAREFLAFYADLFGLGRDVKEERIGRLLKLVGLERAADLRLRKFSRGMLQRIGLAQALINDPKLVILDEPLGGLDPLGRKEIRDIIVRFKQEGKTVFFTSHILQDIEMICDHVAIIVGGRVVKQGALQDLVSEKVLFTEVEVMGVPPEAFRGLGENVSVQGERVLLKVFEEKRVDDVLAVIREKKGKIISLSPRTETLEDIFVETVTGT